MNLNIVPEYVLINHGFTNNLFCMLQSENNQIYDFLNREEIVIIINSKYEVLFYLRDYEDKVDYFVDFVKSFPYFDGMVIKSKDQETNPKFFLDFIDDLAKLDFCSFLNSDNITESKIYDSSKIVYLEINTEG